MWREGFWVLKAAAWFKGEWGLSPYNPDDKTVDDVGIYDICVIDYNGD